MDVIRETIKKIVKDVLGNNIDYSKTYKMKCIAFNPITQSITGESYSTKFKLIMEAPLYSIGSKLLFVPLGTDYLLTFVDANPAEPVALGIKYIPGIISVPGIISLYPTPTPGTPITDGSPIQILTQI